MNLLTGNRLFCIFNAFSPPFFQQYGELVAAVNGRDQFLQHGKKYATGKGHSAERYQLDHHAALNSFATAGDKTIRLEAMSS